MSKEKAEKKSTSVSNNEDENVQERGTHLEDPFLSEGDEVVCESPDFIGLPDLKRHQLSLPTVLRMALNNLAAYSIHGNDDRSQHARNADSSNILAKVCFTDKMETYGVRNDWTALTLPKGVLTQQASQPEPLILCVDGPDCSGKTTLLNLLERVDLWGSDIDPKHVDQDELLKLRDAVNTEFHRTNDNIRGFNEKLSSAGLPLTNLASFISSYPGDSKTVQTERSLVRMPLCRAWQHPNGNPAISSTGHTIRQWLKNEDALSGKSAGFPAAGVQASFTASWEELMAHIAQVNAQEWRIVSSNRTWIHEAKSSPVHLVDRSCVSMVVYGLLGGVPPKMLTSLSKMYTTVPVLLLAPPYALVAERLQRGDDAMSAAEQSKYGILHAVCSLYNWLRMKHLGWLASTEGNGMEKLKLHEAAAQLPYMYTEILSHDQAVSTLQIQRTGIEAEMAGDGLPISSMINLAVLWINIHLAGYKKTSTRLPSVSAYQYLQWAYEWVLTWPGQKTPAVREWFGPIRESVVQHLMPK